MRIFLASFVFFGLFFLHSAFVPVWAQTSYETDFQTAEEVAQDNESLSAVEVLSSAVDDQNNLNVDGDDGEITPDNVPAYVRTSSLAPESTQFDLKTLPSLLFTYWEQAAIVEAMLSDGFARPTTYSEMFDEGQLLEDRPKPPPEARYLTLGGIVYRSADKWTVWFNGKRVTPQALPSEAIDFKVKKDFIEIKWYDEYTNQIFPVRLRPHQRFNIDTRIFLPG